MDSIAITNNVDPISKERYWIASVSGSVTDTKDSSDWLVIKTFARRHGFNKIRKPAGLFPFSYVK